MGYMGEAFEFSVNSCSQDIFLNPQTHDIAVNFDRYFFLYRHWKVNLITTYIYLVVLSSFEKNWWEVLKLIDYQRQRQICIKKAFYHLRNKVISVSSRKQKRSKSKILKKQWSKDWSSHCSTYPAKNCVHCSLIASSLYCWWNSRGVLRIQWNIYDETFLKAPS